MKNDKSNVLMIGAAGQMGGFYWQRLGGKKQNNQVDCTPFINQLVKVDKQYEDDAAILQFSSLEKALPRGPYDVVMVCVDVQSHSEVILQVLNTEDLLQPDAIVFSQKPLAATLAEAEHICALAEAKNTPFFVGDQTARQPALMSLAERIKETGAFPFEIAVNYLKNRGARTAGQDGQKPKVYPVKNCFIEEGSHFLSRLIEIAPTSPTSIQARSVRIIPIWVDINRANDAKQMGLMKSARKARDKFGEFDIYFIPGGISLEVKGEGWRSVINCDFETARQERSITVHAHLPNVEFFDSEYPNSLIDWRVDFADYNSGPAQAAPSLTEWSGHAYMRALSAVPTQISKFGSSDVLGEELKDLLTRNPKNLATAREALIAMALLDAGNRSIESLIKKNQPIQPQPYRLQGEGDLVNIEIN